MLYNLSVRLGELFAYSASFNDINVLMEITRELVNAYSYAKEAKEYEIVIKIEK